MARRIECSELDDRLARSQLARRSWVELDPADQDFIKCFISVPLTRGVRRNRADEALRALERGPIETSLWIGRTSVVQPALGFGWGRL